MADARDVTVPDIGDFEGVPVIEILVAAGDEVAVEQPLVTLESDKATMDVPAPFAGKVAELKVSVGDEVSEGSVLMVVEASEGGQDATADREEPSANGDEARAAGGGSDGGGAGSAPEAAPQAEAAAPPVAERRETPDIVSGEPTLGRTGLGMGRCTRVPRCGGWLVRWG